METRKEEINIQEIQQGRKLAMEEQKLLLDKVTELRRLLSDFTIDADRTILGSEHFYKLTLEEEERQRAREKLMELIVKL